LISAWNLAQTPLVGAHRVPQISSWNLGGPTSKEREMRRSRGKKEMEGKKTGKKRE